MRPYILAEQLEKRKRFWLPDSGIAMGSYWSTQLSFALCTDNYLAELIAEGAVRIAHERGAKVIVLPTIPFGVNTGQADIKLDMNLNPGTQFMILKDLITVLDRQGIKKFVILNSHGGNDFKQMIRELNLIFPDMFISQCHWFKIPGLRSILTIWANCRWDWDKFNAVS